MKNIPRPIIFILLPLVPIFIFFSSVIISGKVPIPADTIVGLYHPFRDVTWDDYTAGVPFKNFLITDAVRQQYPWRKLAIDLVRRGELPGWNPYTHAGTPLAANIQNAVFYPLNILFFILPFNLAWTTQVVFQPVMLAIFLFAYLRNLRFSIASASLAAITLSLSGFSVAWLEWNTTLHTLVWVPLSLLALEKIWTTGGYRWYLVLGFSLVSIMLAGFLQTAFYALFLILAYALRKLYKLGNRSQQKKYAARLAITSVIVLGITAVQWLPTSKFIIQSGRATDQGEVLVREDWFLPWQNLVQFIAPDFFGNPATLNYWGIFNYMEFIGYIGIVPLMLAFVGALTTSQTRSLRRFFLTVLIGSLFFATPNPVSRLPFLLNVPFLESAQPSRLMILIDLALAFLVAVGAEAVFRACRDQETSQSRKVFRKVTMILGLLGVILLGLWTSTKFLPDIWGGATPENIKVSQRNLILPTAIFGATGFIMITAFLIIRAKLLNKTRLRNTLFLALFLLTAADLLRFARKFTPFTDSQYLFPTTETIEFLRQDTSVWRYMTTDRRIFPPNFSIIYRLQTIEGYDPLYLSRFGLLIASAQRGEPVLEPVAFRRIIRPDNYESPVWDILNVKYVLSLRDLVHPKLQKVFQEGETRVYHNREAFPRAFLIPNYSHPTSDGEALEQLLSLTRDDMEDVAKILNYSETEVSIDIETEVGGMLVLTDMYYPGWNAWIDGEPIPIERVLYALRGTMIPPGRHEVLYRYPQL